MTPLSPTPDVTESRSSNWDGCGFVITALALMVLAPLTISWLIARDNGRELDERCAHLFARARTYAESTAVMAADHGCEYWSREAKP